MLSTPTHRYFEKSTSVKSQPIHQHFAIDFRYFLRCFLTAAAPLTRAAVLGLGRFTLVAVGTFLLFSLVAVVVVVSSFDILFLGLCRVEPDRSAARSSEELFFFNFFVSGVDVSSARPDRRLPVPSPSEDDPRSGGHDTWW